MLSDSTYIKMTSDPRIPTSVKVMTSSGVYGQSCQVKPFNAIKCMVAQGGWLCFKMEHNVLRLSAF